MDIKNSLMLNDWVSQNGEYKRVDEILYCGINGDWEISTFCRELMDWIKFGDIKPIILTKDNLENNNFTKLENRLYIYRYEEHSDNIITGNYIDCWVDSKGNVTKISIHHYSVLYKDERCPFYINEFQHALRLCGFDELANNLKI